MSDPPPSAAPGIWEREDNGPALPPARGCPLPPRVRTRGKALLNQQFWLWGQDARRDGNLLVRFGFELLRRPAGMQGSNLYVLPDEQIALWGFGLLARWPQRPPIYLGRFRFEPRIPPPGLDARQVWQPDGVSPLTSPVGANAWAATLRPTLETAGWIAEYESWVQAITSPAYRRDCLARWPHAACHADELAASWRSLANEPARTPSPNP